MLRRAGTFVRLNLALLDSGGGRCDGRRHRLAGRLCDFCIRCQVPLKRQRRRRRLWLRAAMIFSVRCGLSAATPSLRLRLRPRAVIFLQARIVFGATVLNLFFRLLLRRMPCAESFTDRINAASFAIPGAARCVRSECGHGRRRRRRCLVLRRGRICERVCGRVCGRVCERICGRVCGRVCGRICERVCGRVCGRVCERVCERVCGRVCERVCGRIYERICERVCGRVCGRSSGCSSGRGRCSCCRCHAVECWCLRRSSDSRGSTGHGRIHSRQRCSWRAALFAETVERAAEAARRKRWGWCVGHGCRWPGWCNGCFGLPGLPSSPCGKLAAQPPKGGRAGRGRRAGSDILDAPDGCDLDGGHARRVHQRESIDRRLGQEPIAAAESQCVPVGRCLPIAEAHEGRAS